MISIKIKSEYCEFEKPLIMGILNITSDSFFAGSRLTDIGIASERISKMFYDGADIIDLGAMSSRPGSSIISFDEEWERLKPVLEIVLKKFSNRIFSVDTVWSQTAKRAVEEYGVDIINDISAGEIDPKMPEQMAELNVPYIIMHMRGTPTNMHSFTVYSSFPGDIVKYFSEKLNRLNYLGINDIIIDPGFGFSKTIDQNYMMLNYLDSFKILELPLLVGLSRKSMIWKYLNLQTETALNGTTALNMFALTKGANILRVHDVKEAKETVELYMKTASSLNKTWC